jgi:DNA-binding transcriptional MerR regulator
MKIGELSERTGLNPSRIRFYESIGLFTMAERQPNGYRVYRDEAVLVLKLIATAQEAGFSLDELRLLLPTDMAAWQHGTLVDTLRRKIEEIDALQVKLTLSKAHLVALVADIEGKPQDMDCATNAQRLLAKMELSGPGASVNGHVNGQVNGHAKASTKASKGPSAAPPKKP